MRVTMIHAIAESIPPVRLAFAEEFPEAEVVNVLDEGLLFDFDDKITRVACPEGVCADEPNSFGSYPTYRINIDEAVTQGVEATLDMPLSETVKLSSSYTYTDSSALNSESIKIISRTNSSSYS